MYIARTTDAVEELRNIYTDIIDVKSFLKQQNVFKQSISQRFCLQKTITLFPNGFYQQKCWQNDFLNR